MGLKKIAEMRAVLRKEEDTYKQFISAAKEYSAAHAHIAAVHAKVEEAYANLEKQREASLEKVKTLQTHGIKEFDDYKKQLIEGFENWTDKLQPADELFDRLLKQMGDISKAEQARLDKLVASFPGEVKVGMVFRFEPTKKCWEITKCLPESKKINLKGDQRLWFEYIDEGGGPGQCNLDTLKKSCKYLKNL